MNSKTNIVRAILMDASECERPEADHPATIEISADDLQRILERHITEPTQCLHQIAEPETQQPCSRSHPHEGMTPQCELRTEIARLTNKLARTEAQLAAAPQAVQAAVPVGGQSRFNGSEDWQWCSCAHVAMVLATPSEWQGYEVRYLYAHPAEGVPANASKPELKNTWSYCEKTCIASCSQSGLRFQLDEDEMPHEYGHAFADMMNVLDATGKLPSELIATQPAAQGMDAKNCIPWVPVQERVPVWTEDESVRVLALTTDADFGGEQVHDIKASDFYLDDGEGVIGTEITEVCTHWVYRDDVWPRLAAQAKQGGTDHG